jgi:hypothetical protein
VNLKGMIKCKSRAAGPREFERHNKKTRSGYSAGLTLGQDGPQIGGLHGNAPIANSMSDFYIPMNAPQSAEFSYV